MRAIVPRNSATRMAPAPRERTVERSASTDFSSYCRLVKPVVRATVLCTPPCTSPTRISTRSAGPVKNKWALVQTSTVRNNPPHTDTVARWKTTDLVYRYDGGLPDERYYARSACGQRYSRVLTLVLDQQNPTNVALQQ